MTSQHTGTTIAARLEAARDRVDKAARAAGRDPADVAILVAAKTQPVPAVREVVLAGGILIGENRVQEMVAKAPGLEGLPAEIHLIGPLQRNKARLVVATADVIETVSDARLAEKLDTLVADGARLGKPSPLPVMVQVNTSGEPTKSGCHPSEAADLAAGVGALAHLRLTGFMTIGLNSSNRLAVARCFAALRQIRDAVLTSNNAGTASAHHLSMGMSNDLDLAIAEGATIVRLGTAIFGSRT